jgi:hypothetical protein
MTKIELDDDLIQTTTIFRRHSKGPVMFNGCSPHGDVIIIDNLSPRKCYDLTGWYIERQTDSEHLLRYTFPDRCLLTPLTTIELWSSAAASSLTSDDTQTHQVSDSSQDQEQQLGLIRLKTSLSTWHTARQWSINRLFDRDGRSRALFSHRLLGEKKDDDHQ